MKKTRRIPFANRVLSIVICLAMLLSYLPASAPTASASEMTNMSSDPSTADSFEAMLGTDNDGNRYACLLYTSPSPRD